MTTTILEEPLTMIVVLQKCLMPQCQHIIHLVQLIPVVEMPGFVPYQEKLLQFQVGMGFEGPELHLPFGIQLFPLQK